ncbi:MAG: NPCBM/NEW2 domain-containing protein, partial [Planctomycetota bacterium]
GVHAPSRITWRLDGAWKELRGWVALDDSALENQFHGSAIFRVHVDGEVLWESPVVRGGDTPLAIPAIDLTQASELVLEVDAATEAFVSDRANWLRPILVRK